MESQTIETLLIAIHDVMIDIPGRAAEYATEKIWEIVEGLEDLDDQ